MGVDLFAGGKMDASGFYIKEGAISDENLHIKSCTADNNEGYGFFITGANENVNEATVSAIGYVFSEMSSLGRK